MRRAFTLIELLVVVAIIAILLSILGPALSSARKKAIILRSMVNQRSTVVSLNLIANDNNDWYPPSIATAGNEIDKWVWADPRLMVGNPNSYEPRMSKGGPRALSGYLDSYVSNPDILHCPVSPNKYKYFDEMWDQGDKWDNPDHPDPAEPMSGSYSFWWNYKGWLTDRGKVFKGPRRSSGGVNQSSLLISDYFGSDTWRNWGQYGSCESFTGSLATPSKDVLTDFWRGGSIDKAPPKFKLRAAYTDGHCETYDSSEVVTLEVATSKDGTNPFPQAIGKGKFYLPRNAAP